MFLEVVKKSNILLKFQEEVSDLKLSLMLSLMSLMKLFWLLLVVLWFEEAGVPKSDESLA